MAQGKQNKVRFGFSQVHYALYTEGADGAVGTWGAPKPIPGAVSFSPTAQGSEYKFSADNGTYFGYTKDNGDAGDLQMALFPDEFLIDILSWEKDENGVLLELANKAQKYFALMFEVDAVDKDNVSDPLRVVYYHAKGAKPSQGFATSEEGVTVQAQTMAITATPLDFGGGRAITRVSVVKSASPTVYNEFFEKVYVPKFSGGSGEIMG